MCEGSGNGEEGDGVNYIDLFSGIGGFSLGFKRAGVKIDKHYASEIDKYARSIYARQFDGSIQLGDVTKIGNDLGEIDIITGGFPCQTFSIAGKRAGFADIRGTLFFEIVRLAGYYRPRYMVLENVKGLLSHDSGNTIRVILDELRRLDYFTQLLVLNTKDFDVPQNRERCFFICSAPGERRPEIFHLRERKIEVACGSNAIDANYYKGIDNHGQRTCVGTLRTHKDGEGFREMQSGICPTIPARGREDGSGQPVISYQRCFKNQYSKKIEETGTLQASRLNKVPMVLISDSGQGRKKQIRTIAPPLRAHDGCGHDNHVMLQLGRGYNKGGIKEICPSMTSNSFEHNNFLVNDLNIRRLTPIECERLQAFPDDWTKYGKDGEPISDSQRYKCLGNSVTVKVIEEISKCIKDVL